MRIVMIAGPNGAGKSTFARNFMIQSSFNYVFLNADDIAREIEPNGQTNMRVDIQAGRQLLERLEQLVLTRQNIMIETTLSGATYAQKIPNWRRDGYIVEIHYLRLPSANASITRVGRRVAAGGHGIPEHVLRRRFGLSLSNFMVKYRPIVDQWYLYESSEGDFVLIDEGKMQ